MHAKSPFLRSAREDEPAIEGRGTAGTGPAGPDAGRCRGAFQDIPQAHLLVGKETRQGEAQGLAPALARMRCFFVPAHARSPGPVLLRAAGGDRVFDALLLAEQVAAAEDGAADPIRPEAGRVAVE